MNATGHNHEEPKGIPDYQKIMLPLLRRLEDGAEHSMRELINALAVEFGLTEEERKQLLPSGVQPVFDNRVGWARTYLLKAGLLESPRRGIVKITDRGRQVLAQKPEKIDNNFLYQFEDIRPFLSKNRDNVKIDDPPELSMNATPVESIEREYRRLREELAEELLQLVKKSSPRFFEHLVVQLLVAMGYGGSHHEAAKAIGQTRDEGIDGVINEDRLGLDVVYIQAKRWDTSVGRPEIQKFVGALQGKRAKKGIFITTSTFSKEAREYASTIDIKVVLIDGRELVDLMIDYDVGVVTQTTYRLKKIDYDFFEG